MATIDQARAAKERARTLLAGEPRVNGVGIAPAGDGFCLRVDLVEEVGPAAIPAEIDGVPVETAVTGRVRALGNDAAG